MVLAETLFGVLNLYAAYNALKTIKTPVTYQLAIVFLIYYIINFVSIVFLYRNENECCFLLVLEIVMFIVISVYSIILHFRGEVGETGWGYKYITLIFYPYMLACIGITAYTISHMHGIK